MTEQRLESSQWMRCSSEEATWHPPPHRMSPSAHREAEITPKTDNIMRHRDQSMHTELQLVTSGIELRNIHWTRTEEYVYPQSFTRIITWVQNPLDKSLRIANLNKREWIALNSVSHRQPSVQWNTSCRVRVFIVQSDRKCLTLVRHIFTCSFQLCCKQLVNIQDLNI